MHDREQFEAAVCNIVPRPLFSRNEDGSYQETMVRGFWSLWQAAHAEGRRSALEELHPQWLKEKERADRAEEAADDARARAYHLANSLEDANSAQPLQQEGGKEDYPEPLSNFQEGQWWVQKLDEAAKTAADLDFKRAVAVVHHLLKSASDNLQQASTAQAEPAKRKIDPAQLEANALRRRVESATAADWPEDFAHENGNYENRCSGCGIGFMGHKRRSVCKVCAIPAQATPEGADLPPLPEDMDTVECIQLSSIDSPEFAELMGAYASAPTLDAAWAVLQYADKRMHAIMARRFALAATRHTAEPVAMTDVLAAIRTVDKEAESRGGMLPQDADEHRADRRAVQRVLGMLKWYGDRQECEKWKEWPRRASPPQQVEPSVTAEMRAAMVEISDEIASVGNRLDEIRLRYLPGPPAPGPRTTETVTLYKLADEPPPQQVDPTAEARALEAALVKHCPTSYDGGYSARQLEARSQKDFAAGWKAAVNWKDGA